MLKFFRKIRQKLLSESKFTKYLLYAIGEIVLVVIGILIALSINNSNDLKNQRQKELTLLTEMRQNLKIDLEDLDFNIKGSFERIQANEIILKALQERVPMNDSLKPYYGNIIGNFQLSNNTAAWENLKSVGVDLVSDDSLRNAISNLYEVKYTYLENTTKGVDDGHQWNTLYPQFLDLINMDQVWVSAEPVSHEALMDNRKFQETLKMNLFIRNFMLDQYETIHQDVNSLLDQIERHLLTLKEQ
ncbi:DUF6090 family protein [Algoriphagus namhaensis]|uniref:DUF6090 family protein n=1 Tax=Algoriphagus namhaensis TaxID=915353 RepID=A0ABV8ARR5_9BACT